MTKKKRKYRDNEQPTSEGFIGKLFAATADRLPANVTEEQDWYMDTPDVRLARVFTIVLILHVVAVGGILAFKMIDKASAPGVEVVTAEQGSVDVAIEEGVDDRNIPVTPAAPDPLIMQDPTRQGLQQYLVSRGETMQTIASDLKLDVRELERLNSIHVGNTLYPGQWIAIPKADEKPVHRTSPTPVSYTPAEEAVAAAPRTQSSVKTYVVKPGDTAYGIARQFGMTSDSLMAANGIARAESLQVGATLRIPAR